jgi:transposase
MRPTGSKAELERRRRLGVALHRRGLSIREVARELDCAPGSVARWTKMFNEGGDEGLDPIPNAGGTSRMTDMDRVKLVVLLRLGARMNGFSTDLWTLRRMRDVIEREFKIRYSISNVHNIVRELGFSPQQAIRRAREQDETAVAEFRDTTWAEIKKKPGGKVGRSR